MDICKALNLHCTYRQAVEAMLVSRGQKLEESESFDLVKMLEYLNYKKQFMPPADDHRALIKKSVTSQTRGSRKQAPNSDWGH
jgi:hypothetical protein